MSRADRLSRASRLSGLALCASLIQESLYRWKAGEKLTDEDKWRYHHFAELFDKALYAHAYTMSLIMGSDAPEPKRDFVDCADAMKFATRILPEKVKDPEGELNRYKTLILAFAEERGEAAMVEPVKELMGKIANCASGEAQHVLDGLYD